MRKLDISGAAGYVKGKLSYVAPEQIRADRVDARVDVFALSVVLWEMLSSTRLFGGGSPADTVRKVLKGDVPPLASASARYVPPRVEAIVRRGLDPDRARRFQSAKALAAALEAEVSPIPAREVSAWLVDLGEAPLAQRARQLAWVESSREPEPPSAEISQMIAISRTERSETPARRSPPRWSTPSVPHARLSHRERTFGCRAAPAGSCSTPCSRWLSSPWLCSSARFSRAERGSGWTAAPRRA